MERPIWAPWRMEYIAGEKPPGCIFCQFPAAPESDDRANLVVHRAAHSFTCLNRYPYNSGHVMVIPRAHVSDLAALAQDAWVDLQDELRRAVAVVQAAYRPEGMNVGMNLGKAAGAGIEPHLVYPPDERSRFLEELMGGAAGAVADAVTARLAGEARAAQAPGIYFLAQ